MATEEFEQDLADRDPVELSRKIDLASKRQLPP